jgi:hypothetical protein
VAKLKEETTEHEDAQKSARERNLFWQKEITRSLSRNETWWERGGKVVDTYRGITSDSSEVFNILWANTEVLKPAIYSHVPVPEVTRRYLENDPIGEVMAMVMERSIEFCMQTPGEEFDDAAQQVRDDVLLPGRGLMRVFYDAQFEEEEHENLVTDPATGNVVNEPLKIDKKVSEQAYARYVYWKDFLTSSADFWREVWWVAFATNMSRADLVEEFGEKGRLVPTCGSVYDKSNLYEESGDFKYSWTMGGAAKDEQYARVWEIWDSRTRTVIVVSEGYDEVLDEFDDPYELDGFFPTPQPLYAIKTTGSLEPVPEYTMYQYQAEELNTLTRRISRLTEALKARGIGDADIKSLQRLFSGEDNEIILDEEFGKLMQAGGIANAISWAPIKEIADVLSVLQPRRQECLAMIYELTGIADIMRGASQPYDTATAVEKKGQYGTARIKDRQKRFQKYCRDVLSLLGEVIANLFDPETLVLMSGVENKQEVMQGMEEVYKRLQNNAMRDYTINIQTDSTIAVNEQDNQEEALRFFGAVGGLMKEIFPAIENGMIPPEVAKELLLFAARRFDAGRELISTLEKVGAQPPQQKPEEGQEDQTAMAQASLQIAQMQQQVEMAKLELEKQKAQQDFAIEQGKLQLKAAELQMEAQMESAANQIKIATEYIRQETVKINAQGKEGGSNAG